MTTKEYLNQIRDINAMIDCKIKELAELREMSVSISAISNSERVQSSKNGDTIGRIVAKIDQMEREIDQTIDKYIEIKNTIIGQIGALEDTRLSTVLKSKYFGMMSLDDIADRMSYSHRQIIRLHGVALSAFEKKYGHTYL